MHTGQMHMRRIAAFGDIDLLMRIPMLSQRTAALPAVGNDCRILLNVVAYKWNQTVSAHVGNALHPNSSKSLRVMNFKSDHHDSFLSGASPPPAALFLTSDERFVNFDIPVERTSARSNHRPTYFMKPAPGGLVTVQTKNSLEPQGASSEFLTCYVPDRLEPKSKRFPCSLKNCSGHNRRFMPADGASKESRFHMPRLVSITYRTNKTVRSSKFQQIINTVLLCRKPVVELSRRFRVINSGNWTGIKIIHAPL